MRIVVVVAGLLIVGALGGCLGSGAKDSSGPGPGRDASRATASTSYVKDDSLGEKGRGGIQGSVKNEYGSAVKAAHVSLMGTTNFTDSDAAGRFAFSDLLPAKYPIRVDAKGYAPYDGQVDVEAGQIAIVDILLARLSDPNATVYVGYAHKHDWWGDDTSYVIMDKDIQTGPGGVCAGAVTFPCNGGAQFVDFYSSDNPNERPNNVWPGTGKMEIHVKGLTKVIQPFYIQVQGPKGSYTWAKNQYLVSKEDQKITLGPLFDENNTDPPHFRSSGWKFRLWSASPASAFIGPMHWTITIFRDVGRELPVDEPHPDYWRGETRKLLIETSVAVDCAKPARAANPPTTCTGYGTGPSGLVASTDPYKIPKDRTITTDTGRMVVTLKWTNSETALAHKPAIEFCAADQACAYTSAIWRPAAVTKDGATERVFDFEVRPEWWDSPYVNTTRWAFRWSFDDPNGETTGQVTGNMKGTLTWSIEIYKVGAKPA